MPLSSRLTVRLDPDLKQALALRSEQTGIPINVLISQAIRAYLSAVEPMPSALIQDLIQRVEKLEVQYFQPSPSLDLSAPVAALPPTDPHLWNPVFSSFEDWLYQTWQQLATAQSGQSDPWGEKVSVDAIQQLGFHSMRPQRFQDRLSEAEVEGLVLFDSDELGQCRTVDITFCKMSTDPS